jgi:ceramide glucosyltransferase
MVRMVVEVVAAACAVSGTAFYLFSIWSAWRFLRLPRTAPDFHPPVSILKPFRGADPHAYECFRSHCGIDYPEYEIVFGVHDPADPAVPLVKRLQREFPERRIELVVCPLDLGTNRKVSNLIQMLPAARYEHLLVNDGDIHVPPDYLRRIVAPLAELKIGLVTALYRAVAGRTLGSKLEALSINDFATAVLVSYENRSSFHYGFGSTLAFPRRVLERVGGFQALSDYLADDHQLGTLIAEAGYKIVLSDLVVETTLPDYSLRDFWDHQMRWARTIRDASPRGNIGLALVFGVQWAALAVITATGAAWSWGLFVAAYAARVTALLVAGFGVCRDRHTWRRLWLLPLRDIQALLVWAASYAGRTIIWRGDRFLLKHGRLLRTRAPTARPPSASPSRQA